jgi:thioredoxin-dependent peroxiredoxin
MGWFKLCSFLLVATAPAAAAPDVGDPAPPFTLRGSDGEVYQLSQFVGRTPVVIAWFPKAFTGG